MKTWEEAVEWLRRDPNQQALSKACYFDDPISDAAERYAASTEWLAVQKLLSNMRRGHALDLGAGRGISAFALARGGWRVTALEPNRSDVVGAGAIQELIHQTGASINVVEQWGESLPFADEAFDLVHCRQVLHHARDLSGFCREAGRVLRKGGLFIATREHVLTNSSDLMAFKSLHALDALYGGEHAYTLREYKNAIESSAISLQLTLNSKSSDINLFPGTISSTKERWARKLRIWPAKLIPTVALKIAGALSNEPGRLYTFVGTKI